MEFTEKLMQFGQQVKSRKDSIATEEATKTSLVMPFFKMLGYDVFNPLEFIPEFTADVGIKKGEKVDYAIMVNNEPVILIECKSCNQSLDKHGGQLFRYFATTSTRFGILTNGITYQFYTDLDNKNIMDSTPFLEFDVLNIKENLIPEIMKFSKADLNVDNILNAASELKYTRLIKDWLAKQTEEPSEDFIKFIMDVVYDGKRTQKALNTFQPLVKHSLKQFLNEQTNERLKAALRKDVEEEADDEEAKEAAKNSPRVDEIITIETTLEELEAYAIVKSILRDVCDVNRLSYRHTTNYMVVVFDDNGWKRICRFWFKGKQKFITTPDENKNPIRYDISNLNDIYDRADYIREVCKRYL